MIDHPIVRLGLLLRRVESIETRKKFQKIVHILQVMGAPFPEAYDFHHYGPYSSELHREIEAFKSEGLIQETAVEGPYTSFRSEPTPQLLELLKAVPDQGSCPWVEWANELNGKSPRELEGISTLLYFYQRLWKRGDWKLKFEELKPQIAALYDKCEAEALRLLDVAGLTAA